MLTPVISSVLGAHGVGMDKMRIGSPSDPPARVGITVEAAVFFDGTLNNRANTGHRLNAATNAKSAAIFKSYGEADNSFANYYSNVAIMEFLNKNIDGAKHQVSVYVEGIGTTDDRGDTMQGYVMGSGYTGIVQKVLNGINLLTERLLKLPHARNEYIERVVIDVYGFSRGSAAARHFVSRKTNLHRWQLFRTTLGNTLKIENPDHIVFRFVGLYDTVSSFQEVYGNPLLLNVGYHNFSNDVGELDLAMGGTVRKAVHLTAGDEYRSNFALTTIGTTVQAGKGYELQLPGAHSDIGGGYAQTEAEERELGNAKLRAWFISQGWYAGPNGEEKDLKKWQETRYAPTGYGPSIPYQVSREVGFRKAVPYNYQFVALGIMLDLAERQSFHGQPAFSRTDPRRAIRVAVPEDLASVQGTLHQFALANDGARSIHATLPEPQLKWLRNKYLHLSASDSIGKGFNLKNGLPERPMVYDTNG